MRWTKGKYQFFVCTHTDKNCIHNHIYYNATAHDRSRKFHNFLGSSFAVRRLSDRVCIENGLSYIVNPKQRSKSKYKHYGEWLYAASGKPLTFQQRLVTAIDNCLADKPGSVDAFLAALEAAGFEHKWGRGGVLSFRAEGNGQERFTRLRASTLGEGYGQDDIIAAIEGRGPLPGRAALSAGSPRKVNLIIDIQDKMRNGKGPAYERWAKVYNLKQMAAALQFLQENGLMDYAALEKKAAETTGRFHKLSEQIKTTEAAQQRNRELTAAVVDYAKTRPVFEGYKAIKYSRKHLAEHEAEIAQYRASQEAFKRILQGAKLPKMADLRAEAGRLAAAKKADYAEYRAVRRDMQEVVTAKANIDRLLSLTDTQKTKEMER
jgi:hypothetical protein